MNRRRLLQTIGLSAILPAPRFRVRAATRDDIDLAPKEALAAGADAAALGLKPDGETDNLPLLRSAISRATAAGEDALYVPPGIYNFVARSALADRVLLPPHFRLWSRPNSGCVFQIDPISYSHLSDRQVAGLLAVNHGDIVEGIDFDGRKDLVNAGEPTNFGGNFITRVSDAVSDVVIRNCVMSNNPGGPHYETFAAQTGFLSRRWTFENVVCRDNNGTGISVNGNMMNEYAMPGRGLPSDIVLIGCSGVNNLWQGLTLYGARRVRVKDCVGLRNGAASIYGGQGLNLEWVSEVSVEGGRYEDNAGPGVGGFGWIENVEIGGGVTIRNNNRNDQRDQGEIGFKPGVWYTGPRVAGNVVPFRGSLQSLRIARDADVAPKATGAVRNHLYIEPDRASNFATGTTAASGAYPAPVGGQPASVLIQAHDAADWTVACNAGSGTKPVDLWLPGIKPDVSLEQTELAGPLSDWSASNMTATPYSSAAGPPGAVLLTTTALGGFAGQTTRLSAPDPLPPSRIYLAQIRYRNLSGDQNWGFCARMPGWNTSTGAGQFDAHLSTLPGDAETWYTAFVLIRTPPGGAVHPRIYNYGPAAGAQLALVVSIKALIAPAGHSAP